MSIISYMTPFIKSLITLLFKIAVIALVAWLLFLIVAWAAALFAVPAGIIQVLGFIIFLYAAYRVVMLILAFLESNPVRF